MIYFAEEHSKRTRVQTVIAIEGGPHGGGLVASGCLLYFRSKVCDSSRYLLRGGRGILARFDK